MYRYKRAPAVLPCLTGYPWTTLNAYKDWDHYEPSVYYYGLSQVAQRVRNPPATQETRVPPPGWEDPLEEGMATHSSILAWEILWTEEPGGLQSMGSQTVRHSWSNWARRHTCITIRVRWALNFTNLYKFHKYIKALLVILSVPS